VPTPTPLFLVGVGRSGTTALAEIFAQHPEVVLGMERFKVLWGERIEEMTPELFERERFFDLADGLTNIRPDVDPRWGSYYERQAAKWDAARYVGDKMTRVRMDQLWSRLPSARFVCIVRAPEDVAASWDVRANSASDVNWPEGLNSERAIKVWNVNNTKIRRAARQRPEQALVVEYTSLFSDSEATSLRRALEWLGLDFAPEVATAFAAAHELYQDQIAGRERTLSPKAQQLVDTNVSPDLWKHLLKLAV
jgi:hypothetical protein